MRLLQTTSFYSLAIALLCLGYLGLQVVGIPFTFLEADEFWFAHHIYEYTKGLPYQDFIPYKTVLGYYILSLPLYFAHGLMAPVYYIKSEIALINTVMIALSAWWGARLFQPRAVFYTLLILVSSQVFLVYSSEARVDMLTSWFCLLSILFLVSQRTILSGLLIGLAFLVSQKALWYLVSTDLALGIVLLAGKQYRKDFRALLAFNFSALTCLLIYILFWSYLISFKEVIYSVFYESFILAKMTYYQHATWFYWRYLLQHGPLLVMLLPLTFLTLFSKSVSSRRLLVISYSLLSFGIIAAYRQFFPYNMVFLLPAFFILYSDFFSWLQTSEPVTTNSRSLFWFFSGTIFYMVELILIMCLPFIYLLALLIPLILWRDLALQHTVMFRSKIAIGGVIIITGIIAPLFSFSTMLNYFNGDYQRENVQITDALLQNGGSYIAGALVFADKDLSLDGFKDLIGPALDYARTGDKTMLPLLMASLKITPKTSTQMLDELQHSNLKVLINSLRINGLPPLVLKYLRSNYQHYWAGVYLYAPTISKNAQSFQLKFAGDYTIQSDRPVVIDLKTYAPNQIVFFQEGKHSSSAEADFRLGLKPSVPIANLNVRYYHDWPYSSQM